VALQHSKPIHGLIHTSQEQEHADSYSKNCSGCWSLAVGSDLCQCRRITGAGATFPAPIYAKWADAYQKATGNRLNYQSIGSGGGIKQITAKTVDFGASDMPMTPEELAKDGLTQFPTVIGGVVPVVNLAGHQAGRAEADGRVAGRHLPGQDHQVE
jgi:phosphate transport system substrate-binding protein